MIYIRKIFIVELMVIFIFSSSCKKTSIDEHNKQKPKEYTLSELSTDPNSYYTGCVTCNLSLEERGTLFKNIWATVKFKNETDYPIPVQKNTLFIGHDGTSNKIEMWAFDIRRDGKGVMFLGPSVRRFNFYPEDYYVLPPRGKYEAVVNLGKHYNLLEKGKYFIKYMAGDTLSGLVNVHGFYFVIESNEVVYDNK